MLFSGLSKALRRSALLVTLVALTACDQKPSIIVGWHPVQPANEISQILAAELENGMLVQTREFKNSAELMTAVRSGDVDLAIVEEPSKPIPDLQVLRAMFPSVLHVLVKPELVDVDFNQSLIADVVRGNSVYAGPAGGAGNALVGLLIEQQVFPPLSEFTLMESIFDGEPDISVIFGGILSQNDQKRFRGHRLISLGSLENYGRGSWAEGLTLRTPSLQPFIIPDGVYPGISNDPVLSLSVQSLLVTHPDLPDDIAYQVLEEVDKLMAQFRTVYSLAGRQMQGGEKISFNLATHNGAKRYLQREAPGFLERYAELLAFIVTAILALSSLVVALIRMRKQARKDRIDVYFHKLLDLREQRRAQQLSAQQTIEEVVALQHTVTNLVSDERIAADNAFLGFLELSNKILDEAE